MPEKTTAKTAKQEADSLEAEHQCLAAEARLWMRDSACQISEWQNEARSCRADTIRAEKTKHQEN